jgi:hypothetical protein
VRARNGLKVVGNRRDRVATHFIPCRRRLAPTGLSTLQRGLRWLRPGVSAPRNPRLSFLWTYVEALSRISRKAPQSHSTASSSSAIASHRKEPARESAATSGPECRPSRRKQPRPVQLMGRLLPKFLADKTYRRLVSRLTGRKEAGIFPTRYRANTARSLSRVATRASFRGGFLARLETPSGFRGWWRPVDEAMRSLLPAAFKGPYWQCLSRASGRKALRHL